MDLGLRQRVVLVTGGSSGIGRATAVAFGGEGARVALTYRNDEAPARKVVTEVQEAGGDAVAVPLDLASHDSIAQALDTITSTWDGLDVLVNNAVEWPRQTSWPPDFTTTPTEDWRRTLRTNLEGVIDLTQQAIALLRAAESGRIVFVSSGTVEYGNPGEEAYAAAKSGLHGFAKVLARELGPQKVLVNTVMPGLTLTDRCLTGVPERIRQTVAEQTPTQRLSTPDDVAGAVVFLSSRLNGNITGEIVRISGGI